MPHKAISREEWKIRRQEEYQRRISNPEAFEKKKERDRIRKQEKRRQNRLIQQDLLSLLADAATQREILNEVDEEEEEVEEDDNIIDPLAEPEEVEEDNGPFEQEDGPILEGFGDDSWNREEEQDMMIYQ